MKQHGDDGAAVGGDGEPRADDGGIAAMKGTVGSEKNPEPASHRLRAIREVTTTNETTGRFRVGSVTALRNTPDAPELFFMGLIGW